MQEPDSACLVLMCWQDLLCDRVSEHVGDAYAAQGRVHVIREMQAGTRTPRTVTGVARLHAASLSTNFSAHSDATSAPLILCNVS